MKNAFHVLSVLTLTAVLVGVCSLAPLYAQQSSPQAQQPPSQQDPQSGPQATPPSTPPEQQSPSQAGQTPGQTGQQTAPSQQAQPSDSSGGQVFTGTVVKSGEKYVLQDAGGKTYDLDHQDQVAKFEGKQVRVRGTLDGKTIHIH